MKGFDKGSLRARTALHQLRPTLVFIYGAVSKQPDVYGGFFIGCERREGRPRLPREFKREPGLGDEAYSWQSAEQNFEIAIRVKRSIVYVDYASLSGDYGVPPTAEQIARVKALAARLAKSL